MEREVFLEGFRVSITDRGRAGPWVVLGVVLMLLSLSCGGLFLVELPWATEGTDWKNLVYGGLLSLAGVALLVWRGGRRRYTLTASRTALCVRRQELLWQRETRVPLARIEDVGLAAGLLEIGHADGVLRIRCGDESLEDQRWLHAALCQIIERTWEGADGGVPEDLGALVDVAIDR